MFCFLFNHFVVGGGDILYPGLVVSDSIGINEAGVKYIQSFQDFLGIKVVLLYDLLHVLHYIFQQ